MRKEKGRREGGKEGGKQKMQRRKEEIQTVKKAPYSYVSRNAQQPVSLGYKEG